MDGLTEIIYLSKEGMYIGTVTVTHNEARLILDTMLSLSAENITIIEEVVRGSFNRTVVTTHI